jgi:5'(3')-deoxyribonucleotidase
MMRARMVGEERREPPVRLGIDLDGVVADFNAGWIRAYNDEFGAEIPIDAVRTWDGLQGLTHFPDMDGFWRWAEGGERHGIFRHLEPYGDALEALTGLVQDHHRIVIVTSRPGWAVHDTFAWIAEHHIPTREVHITGRKWRVPCDIYLEDAPHHLRSIHRNRPEAMTCRFVRPWNDPVPGVHDVADWRGFVAIVLGAGLGGTRDGN